MFHLYVPLTRYSSETVLVPPSRSPWQTWAATDTQVVEVIKNIIPYTVLIINNIKSIAYFATRTQNKSSTAIDNIFVNNSRLESSYTSPLINGLSDHDAQFLSINNKIPKQRRTRTVESVSQKQDTNCMFNWFLSTFLSIFEASFPVIYKNINMKQNDWITQGIKMPCKHKCTIYTCNEEQWSQSKGTLHEIL